MAPTAVIFETNPRPPQPWLGAVCAQLGLTFIDSERVAQELSKDVAVRAQLLKSRGENPALAPAYLRGLAAVASGATRLGLHSVSWLAYGQPAVAVVVDLAGVEDERRAGESLGLSPEQVEVAIAAYLTALEGRLDRFGPPAARRLMLEAGLSDAQKVSRAVAFLAPLLGP